MSWRIATRHASTYRYEGSVIASYNEARITPVSRAGQRVVEAAVVVAQNGQQFIYRDYWGTTVVAFDVPDPHPELVVTGTSVVETPSAPAQPVDLGWDRVHRPETADLYAEYLLSTPHTTGDAELEAIAVEYGVSETPALAAEAISSWVRSALEYEIGATSVSTSALEAWRERRGVCQDFAHVTLVLLRRLGVPARYVSGYLHPDEDAEIGAKVNGASHAWVEYWVDGWHAVDPTNGAPVGDRHVAVARGRDYADVAPFKGVYHGAALGSLEVVVELTRLS